jgi:hypothetical protein
MIYIDIYAVSLAIPTDPCSILIFTAVQQSAPSVQRCLLLGNLGSSAHHAT